MEDWRDVCAAGAIPVGGMLEFVCDGRPIVVCRTAEGWFAVDDRCTHADTPLHDGWLRGCKLVCPLHGAAFDVRDGRVLGPPAFHWLVTHRVRVVAERVQVQVAASAARR